ncbi:MAG: IS110 family transposase, partial [Pseudomonadota bacterium]
MNECEAFVALDVAKLKNAVAIAESGRSGEVRYLGEIASTDTATRALVEQLMQKYERLTFIYEAGSTGYGLYRLIRSRGHECLLVAPSLIPTRPGDRVKTNRRDAEIMAKLLRAGELTAVWVPDERHGAMRELARARDVAQKDLRMRRQLVSGFLLRQGVHYPGKKTSGKAHLNLLANQKLDHVEQRFAFEELLLGMRQASERSERIEQAIRDALPDWSLAPNVTALQAMRGIDTITAVGFLAEVGDTSRLEHPGQLMAYLGLAPSEKSTGERVKRGAITKAGNIRARRFLIESAWSYRFPARVSKEKQEKVAAATRPVREIAWNARTRLCGRFRKRPRQCSDGEHLRRLYDRTG